jgi:DNA polymerase III alpha subunit
MGLTLRSHPVTFLRDELISKRIISCAAAMASPDRRWVQTAGLVLVRQRPDSAKGVMLITIEDETGIANLVIWPSLFEKQRRIILSAGMFALHGRIQREGGRASRRAAPNRPLNGTLKRRRKRRSIPVTAWPRGRVPSWKPGSRSEKCAQRSETAGHLRSLWAHQANQGEAAGFQIAEMPLSH